jgi:tRNA(fMet)-specific endonuclease VapC
MAPKTLRIPRETELKTQGQPIGAYDCMIAGHARSRGLILVTRNISEFSRVPGLRVESWM